MVRYLYNEGAFSHYQRLYYLYDTLGSVAQVTAENGLALQEYLYTPYGEAYNTAADSVNGLRFVGRYGGYTDDDVKLTYFPSPELAEGWHRWYDSADGRWVSRDPIGVAGGVNLYGYVGNRAGYFIDRTGNGPEVLIFGNPYVIGAIIVTTTAIMLSRDGKCNFPLSNCRGISDLQEKIESYISPYEEHLDKMNKDPNSPYKKDWCKHMQKAINNMKKYYEKMRDCNRKILLKVMIENFQKMHDSLCGGYAI